MSKQVNLSNSQQLPNRVAQTPPHRSHKEIEDLALDVLTYGPLMDQIRDNPRQGKIISALISGKAADGSKLDGEGRIKLFVQIAQENPMRLIRLQQKLMASIQPDARRQEYQSELDDLNDAVNRSFDTELPVSQPKTWRKPVEKQADVTATTPEHKHTSQVKTEEKSKNK